MGYTYEFTWVLRLPSEELPDESSSADHWAKREFHIYEYCLCQLLSRCG